MDLKLKSLPVPTGTIEIVPLGFTIVSKPGVLDVLVTLSGSAALAELNILILSKKLSWGAAACASAIALNFA